MKKLLLLSATVALFSAQLFSQGNVGVGTNTPNSKLEVNGSFATKINTVAGAVTLDGTYSTIVATPGSGYTITLPSIASSIYRIYTILYNGTSGGNTITIQAAVGENIAVNGVNSNTFSLTGGTLTLQNDGTVWRASTQAPSSGSGSYVQNNTVNSNFATGQSASFDVTGNAEIGGTFTAGGNVGIGTTSTSNTLDVQGGTGTGTNNGTNINLQAQNGGTGGATNGGNINIGSGTGNGGGANGVTSINAASGNVNVATGTAAQTVNINTGAGVKTTNIGSTNTTSSTTINAGSAGVAVSTLTSGGASYVKASSTGIITPQTGVPGTDVTGTVANATTATNFSGSLSGDVSGTQGATKVNALESATTSVNVSSAIAPTAGQVLKATSSSTATWQADNNAGGTVTSVAALTLGTAGTDLSSSVATNTTTPVITLNVPTASAANRGALSSADWTTFNAKQATISVTTPITLTGASVGMVNQGTTTTVLHGNAAGNSSFSAVNLANDVTGTLSNSNLTNSGALTVTAGTGMSGGGSVAPGGSVTLTNAGVTSIVAGTNVTVSGATGAVTINSTGSGLTGASTANYVPKWTTTSATSGTLSNNTSSIYDNGSVGIGNTAPAQKLDVTGNIRATGAVYANANGAPYLIGGDDATLNDVNVANTVGIIGQQNTALGSVQLGTAGGTISGATGNIGINNISPGAKLDVTGPTTGSGVTINAGGGGDVVLASGGSLFLDGNYSYASGNYIRPIGGANTMGFFTSGAERMRILSGGNVGVGITTPSQKLDVNGAALLEGGGPLYLLDANHGIKSTAGQGVTIFTYGVANGIFLQQSTGNVGIGTTTLNNKLEVSGDINAASGSGFKINNAATAGQYLRGDGTRFVSNAIQAGDLPSGSGNYINNTSTAQTANFNITGTGNVGTLTFTAPTGDPSPVITARTVPAGQGAANEKTELLLYHSNDNVTGGAGADQITLRAPALSFQTYNNPSITGINDNTGYNERMYINPDGLVGVGTNAPGYFFHITRASSADLVVENTGTSPSKVALTSSSNTVTGGVGSISNTDFPLFTNNTDRMMITAAGNVGIGIMTPTFKLTFPNDGSGIGWGTGVSKIFDNGQLYIETDDNMYFADVANSIKMYIGTSGTYAGRVGIGTTTPGFSLQVASGYIGTDYINTTDDASTATAVSGIIVKKGDNFHRTATAAQVLTFLGVTAPTGDNLGNHTATTTLTMGANPISFLTSGSNGITFGAGPYTKIWENGNIHYWTDDLTNYESAATGTGAVWNWIDGQSVAAAGGTTRMQLYNGNLGIGVTSPGVKLQVATGANSTAAIFDGCNAADNTAVISIRRQDLTSRKIEFMPSGYDGTNTYQQINFGYSSVAGTHCTRFTNGTRYSFDASVGIGTNAPGYTLDVNGSFRTVSGNLTMFDDNQYISPTWSNTFNSGYNSNGLSDLWMNYVGYQNGASQFRNFNIGDGKQANIAWFDGTNHRMSINNAQVASYNLDVNGTARITGQTITGCRSGYTAVSDGHICLDNTVRGPSTVWVAIGFCKGLAPGCRVCTHTDLQQACGSGVSNPYGAATGWYGDHGVDTALPGNWDDEYGTWNSNGCADNNDGPAYDGSRGLSYNFRCCY